MSNIKATINVNINRANTWSNLGNDVANKLLGIEQRHDVEVNGKNIEHLNGNDLTTAEAQDLQDDLQVLRQDMDAFAEDMFNQYGIAISPKALQETFNTQAQSLMNIKENLVDFKVDTTSQNIVRSEFGKGYATALRELVRNPAIAYASQTAIPSVQAGYASQIFDATMQANPITAMGNKAMSYLAARRLQNPQFNQQMQQVLGGNFPVSYNNQLGGFSTTGSVAQTPIFKNAFGANGIGQAAFSNMAHMNLPATNLFIGAAVRQNNQRAAATQMINAASLQAINIVRNSMGQGNRGLAVPNAVANGNLTDALGGTGMVGMSLEDRLMIMMLSIAENQEGQLERKMNEVDALEQKNGGESNQKAQMEMQVMQQKMSRTYSMLSTLMSNMHNTAKSMIQNSRA